MSLLRSLLCSFVCAIAVPLGTHAAAYSWQNVAIKGGGFVTGLLFHPAERGLVYARTDVGGVYRLDDAWGTWVPLNDDLGREDSQLTGVLSMAVDPGDPERLYLATGQYLPSWGRTGAILRSADRGATWTRTELPIRLGGNSDGRGTGERLVVDPNDGRILFLGTSQDGLWKSADRGVSWARVTSFPTTATACTLVLVDWRSGSAGNPSQAIYVGLATTTGNSLLRSTDGGSTWAAVPGQPAGLIPQHAELSNDGVGTLYLTYANGAGPNDITAGAVWKLNTGSGGWTNITPPSGQGGFAGLSVDAAHPQHLVVSTIDRWWPGDEVYRSTDGGQSWTAMLAGAVFDHSPAPWSVARAPHWLADVDIDPFDSNRAMFVTGYGVWQSRDLTQADAGKKPGWTFFNDGLEETVPLAIASPPAGASLLSALGDIGGFFHRDLDVSPPLADYFATHRGTTTSIDFAWSDPRIIARTHYDGTRGTYTLDGGTTWTDFTTAPGAATANGPGAIAVSADGSRFVWMPEKSGAFISTNRGTTWTASVGSPSSTSESFTPVADRVNSSKFYIYDRPAGRLYRSSDGGVSFTAAASVPAWGSAPRAVPGHEGHLWLPAWDGGLYRSVDSGATFTKLTNVQLGFRVGFGAPASGQSYPAIFLWGKVSGVEGLFRSDDTGNTWARLNTDAERFGWINDLTGDPRVFGRVYVATGGRGILYGEIAPAPALLPSHDFAVFSAGAAGQYQPTAAVADTLTYTATALPSWATLDPATGVITGAPTEPAGMLHQVALSASDASGNTTVSTVNLFVAAPGDDLRIINLSTRAYVGTGHEILIPGFVLSGDGSRRLLVRAGGPALIKYDVSGVVADPRLTLFSGSDALGSNDDWDAATVEPVATAVGAYPFASDSKDAALIARLGGGPYTAHTSGVNDGTGVALLEVYDADTADAGARLVNISARAVVGTGDDVLIAGFVLSGGGSKRLLLRAVGPTLTRYGVDRVLGDPVLTLRTGQTVLASSDDWTDTPDAARLRDVASSIGAFSLPADSRDSVILATLVDGLYTLSVSGKAGATGVALVEVYLVP